MGACAKLLHVALLLLGTACGLSASIRTSDHGERSLGSVRNGGGGDDDYCSYQNWRSCGSFLGRRGRGLAAEGKGVSYGGGGGGDDDTASGSGYGAVGGGGGGGGGESGGEIGRAHV